MKRLVFALTALALCAPTAAFAQFTIHRTPQQQQQQGERQPDRAPPAAAAPQQRGRGFGGGAEPAPAPQAQPQAQAAPPAAAQRGGARGRGNGNARSGNAPGGNAVVNRDQRGLTTGNNDGRQRGNADSNRNAQRGGDRGDRNANSNRNARNNRSTNNPRFGYSRDFNNGQRFSFRGRDFSRVRAPAYRYPRGFGYRRWSVGALLPQLFLADQYYIDYDWIGLPPPPYGYRWLRYGPDAVMVDSYTGEIGDVVYNVFY